MMEDFLVEQRQLALVEARGRAAKAREVDAFDERRGRGHRLDRIARPQPREQRDERDRLDPFLAQTRHAERTKPLRQFTLGSDKQRLMRSEEHTSELQSLMRSSYAVFCLKKKKQHITHTLT